MKTLYTTLIFLCIIGGAMAQGGFTWAIYDNYTPQHYNYAFDLALDADNNSISAGRSSHSSGSDNQLTIYKHDSDGNEVWQTTFEYQQYISDVEVEVAPNYDIVVLAAFRGDLILGSETINAPNSQEDIVVMKLDSSGALLWYAHDGRTPGGEGVEGLAVDGNGNVYYAAKYSPFTSYVGTDTLSDGPGAFIAKYDSDGDYQWHVYVSNSLESVAVSSDHVYAYGGVSPAGFQTIGDSTFSSLVWGSFIAKIDFDGNLIDLHIEKDATAREVIVTPDDRVFTTGFFNSTDAVIAGDTMSPVTASIDSYIGRYDLDLNPISSFQLSATGFTNGYDIAASSNGHYALLGQFDGDLTFAGTTISATSGFSHQVYVLEFDENDDEVEVYHAFGESASTATEVEESAISAGTNDDFYINGYFKGKVKFGSHELNPGGDRIHMWLAQIGEAGALEVKEPTTENALVIFPNPFNEVLNIQFDAETRGNIKLFDLSGRMVHRQAFNGQSETIHVDHLTSGTYLLNIKTDNGKTYKRKVMIM